MDAALLVYYNFWKTAKDAGHDTTPIEMEAVAYEDKPWPVIQKMCELELKKQRAEAE